LAPGVNSAPGGREGGSEREREREREREGRETLALRSARKQKGKKYERTLHSQETEKPTKRREESSVRFWISFFSFFGERR